MKASRVWLFGTAAAGVYLAVAALSFSSRLLPARPLYDGLAPPPPYRWVSPPPDVQDNQQPEPGSGTLAMTETGSEGKSITTPDGQASVIFPREAVTPVPGATGVEVTITPRAAPAPPSGLSIDGNVYEVSAVLSGPEVPVTLARPATVVLRFPARATVLLRRDGASWMQLETTVSQGSLQVFGDTRKLGTFAAASRPVAAPSSFPWPAYVAAGGALTLAAGGLLLARRRARRAALTRAERRRASRGRAQRRPR